MSNEIHKNKLQLLGKMAASLAHEIRNPLSALQLNLNLIQMSENNLDDESEDCLNACLESVQRINFLVESTLDFSRKSNEKCSVESINDTINDAIHMIENRARRKNVIIKSELKDGISNFKFNRNKITQVVLNLLSNAIEANPKNGIVLIKTYQENEKEILLQVKDSGVGIKDADKNKIFSDFYTNKDKGTGLGLSVCKKILKEFDSQIWFESEEGVGTSFFVKFPLNIEEE